jgi:hypothetical protein
MTDNLQGWAEHWPDPETVIVQWMLSSNLKDVCAALGREYPVEEMLKMREILDLPERPCGSDSFTG